MKQSSMRLVVLALIAVGAFQGCVTDQTDRRPAPRAVGPAGVEEINLLAIPVAVNLDDVPGVDGFVIKFYASNRKRPKPFELGEGQVEILMFDGIPSGAAVPSPLRTWSYTAADLRQHEIRTSIGSGYQLALGWGDAKPASNKISVVARYTAPNGAAIVSAPSIIAVALK